MIYKKTWVRYIDRYIMYFYTGWFLLGVIPIFISRKLKLKGVDFN